MKLIEKNQAIVSKLATWTGFNLFAFLSLKFIPVEIHYKSVRCIFFNRNLNFQIVVRNSQYFHFIKSRL